MVQLDQSQRAFIEAPVDQNIRLLAPAGCGKTLSLLHRCRYIAVQSPNRRPRFLIVTFTRAARDELLSRLHRDQEFAVIRDQSEITTLNSWGFRRIKNAADYPKLITSRRDYHFTMRNQLQPVWRDHERVKDAILSKNSWKRRNAPKNLMDMIDSIKSLGFDHKRHASRDKFVNHWRELETQGLGWRLQEQIDQLIKFDVWSDDLAEVGKRNKSAGGDKETEHDLEEYERNLREDEFYDAFYCFWLEATARLIEEATFTLEDQKYFAYQDEQTNVDCGRFLSGAASYDHVYVDEFQDINPLDLALVRAIVARSRATITIAGDDDQAIFEWRGATPEYILEPQDYFNAKFETHTLGVNYRSPNNIVMRSQLLIKNNLRRVPKRIRAHSSAMAKIEMLELESLTEALEYVSNLVKTSLDEGASPSRIALLSRKRAQIIPYQIFFASKDIPFCAAEDLQIFLSATFERLIRLLTIKEDPERRRSASSVLDDIIFFCDNAKRYPLKKKDKFELRKQLQKNRPRTTQDGVFALAEYRGELKGKNENGETSLEMANAIQTFIDSQSVSTGLLALSQNFEGFQPDLGKAEEDIFYLDPPFFNLAEFARLYEDDYDSFVDDIEAAKETLVHTPPFEADETGEDLSRNPLHLMTALRAKGKEFDRVVLLDTEAGIWPNKNAKTEEQLEAERRVMYVAFTRAREQVTMLLRSGSVPSPYIQELGLRG
ncbi:MAG: ATP-dependent helicase [Chloroflexi bacterium]|nr:ATP-dependent helicase [Chloroflexota bacterium]